MANVLACVKHAAAAAGRDLGLPADDTATASIRACNDIRSGGLHDQFMVDVIHGGAGTSASFNANEVIANRALEHLHRRRRLPDSGAGRSAVVGRTSSRRDGDDDRRGIHCQGDHDRQG